MCGDRKIKYVLHPGFMGSKYISGSELAGLYGVGIDECVVQPDVRDKKLDVPEDTIHLYPRYDGVYNLASLIEDSLCV